MQCAKRLKSILSFTLAMLLVYYSNGQQKANESDSYVLKPAKLFDGEKLHTGWAVAVTGNLITAVGSAKSIRYPDSAKVIALPNTTLMPGMIEGHSHILLHPYHETNWNDQVLVESIAERSARATVHLKKSLMAGFTTMRDLGSEGAEYADVGLKQAIEKGIIPGPRLLVAGKAIVATGSYGPSGFNSRFKGPLGAEAADGDQLIKVVRDQIGHGVDFIKVYADYRWGPGRQARPTFSVEELQMIVETAKSSGRYVVAHASTAEGMRRATLAGVETIEHGDGGTADVFRLMKENNVALCPTIAAGHAILQYRGWKPGEGKVPTRILQKKESFSLALASNVKICAGGDVGVFSHGENVKELILMHKYGMQPLEVLQACTAGNASIMHLDNQLGRLKKGFLADIIAVGEDVANDLEELKQISFVMKDGIIYKQP